MATAKPQASLERMRRFGVKPRRKLGQNFLIDNNILDVIADAAELDPADVVLEIGGGLGVLSEFLASRCDHVHVIEIDRLLSDSLADAVGEADNVSLLFGDAVDVDFAQLTPRPTKFVANLPYNVAATCVIKAFYELPELSLCCFMAQREVAERLTATPGTKAFAASSVLVQAVCEQTTARRLSRNIFHPVPNVDSSLVTLRRTEANPPEGFDRFVRGCFSHRRKPLAGSLALALRGTPEGETIKQQAVEALATIDHGASTRAEQLTASEFLRLHELLDEATA